MSLGDDLKSKSSKAVSNMSAGEQVPAASPKSRPVTPMGNLALVQPTIDALNERAKTAENQVATTREQVRELQQRLLEQPVEANVNALVEVPGRRRKLTDEEFNELVENLRINPLAQPVVVTRLDDGRLEIVSGHNRVHAYRVLRKETIRIVILDVDEADVNRIAFYANLMQPSLPDFQKFKGFKLDRDARSPAYSQRELAKISGVDEKVISRLFAFEDLPEAALALLEKTPHGLGAPCAVELARLTKQGRANQVTDAVRQLLEGKLTQAETVAYAAKPAEENGGQARVGKKVSPVTIRAGRSEFCKYVVSGSTLRIVFKDELMRVEAEKRVAEVLKEVATSYQTSSQSASSGKRSQDEKP